MILYRIQIVTLPHLKLVQPVLGTLPRPVVDSVNIEPSSTLDDNRWSKCCQEDSMSVQRDEHACSIHRIKEYESDD